jgi:threonine dehydrogenase-like Zn-dependent dehydrogenase
MKGIMFDVKMGKFLLVKMHLAPKYIMIRYRTDWPVPEIRYPNQVQVKPILGGICGTDLHMISLQISLFASIFANPQNPFPQGHELVGEVTDAGGDVIGVQVGDRVVFFSFPSCEALGFQLCPSCRSGNFQSCYCLAGVGDGTDLEKQYGGEGRFGGVGGGGFCEYMTGFEKQFFKVPANVPDDAAVLVEPFSVAIHAVARNMPSDDQTVVVMGSGTIGLMVVAALRSLGSGCRIVAIARYPFQASAAQKLGADDTTIEHKRDTLYKKVTEITGGKLFKPIMGRQGVFGGEGPDILYDSVATETSLDDALHLIRSNGKIVIIGQGYTVTKKIDWSIQTFKEIEIIGTLGYGMEPYRGKTVHCYDLALRFLQKNPDMFKGIVTHTFPIDEYRSAFSCARNKKKTHAIKTAFKYR